MTEKFLKSITLCLLNCILRQRFSILVNPNVLYNRLWNGDSKQQNKWSGGKRNINFEKYNISNTLYNQVEVYFLPIFYISNLCTLTTCQGFFFFVKPALMHSNFFSDHFFWAFMGKINKGRSIYFWPYQDIFILENSTDKIDEIYVL